MVGHHAQGPAHPLQQPKQIARLTLRLARKTAQVAEQHGDLGFARGQHDLRVFDRQRVEHYRREELAQRRLPALQKPHLPERTEHGRHQLGELHVLAQIGGIGGRRRRRLRSTLNRPAT